MLIFNKCTITDNGDIYKEARLGGLSFVCVINPLTGHTTASVSDDSGVIDRVSLPTEEEGKLYLLKYCMQHNLSNLCEQLKKLLDSLGEL